MTESPIRPRGGLYPHLKRLVDLTLASAGLLLTSPLLGVIAAWIKLHDGGPVFFSGTRVGRNGLPFRMLKFRTMVVNADKVGPSSTAGDDSRITPPGRFIRRYKLDELSQLFNVVAGDMSLVGPRPQVPWAVDLYTADERNLLTVRPGITDYASLYFRNEGEILRGSTDPDRDYLEKIAPMKIRLGLYYVQTYSLAADLKLVAATIVAVAGVDPAWCMPSWVPIQAAQSATS